MYFIDWAREMARGLSESKNVVLLVVGIRYQRSEEASS